MKRIPSSAGFAAQALMLVESLQVQFVHGLEELGGVPLKVVQWVRDSGTHGGGIRYGIADSGRLGRASVNLSQVHYDDEPERRLGSATALSAIVHPDHPRAPSVHIHISWTELKSGTGYWRMMADLNPAIPNERQTERFVECLRTAAPDEFADAAEQGDRYFFIPALGRPRGVAHFYLENYNTGDFSADLALARRVGTSAIEGYVDLLNESCPPVTDADRSAQLAYHTLYFFQVLTLDRGTTAGLLVHDQNDVGILGSLPPKIDHDLLSSWRAYMPAPQNELLGRILDIFPATGICTVDDEVKQRLADVVRRFYQQYPDALSLQASCGPAPPTVDNHKPGELHGT